MTPPAGPRPRKRDPEAARDLRPDDTARAWYDALLRGGYFAEAGPDDVALRRVQAALDALRAAEEEKIAASLPPGPDTGEVPPAVWGILIGVLLVGIVVADLFVAIATVAMLAGGVAMLGLAAYAWGRIRMRRRYTAAVEGRRRAGEELRAAVPDARSAAQD